MDGWMDALRVGSLIPPTGESLDNPSLAIKKPRSPYRMSAASY